MKRIDMQFENTAYPIIIDKGWEATLSKIPSNIFLKKALIISDTNVGPLYSNEIIKALSENNIGIRTILIDPGESSKTIEKAMDIYTTALNFRMDRDSLFIALGGGVVGDLAGFTASTYMRGVPYLQIPTSLLAQVDSSVGGKTAVNHPLGKNMIGSFYQPKGVLINTDTLKSLPVRQISTGLAEVIKYGVIADKNLFSYLEENIEKVFSFDDKVLNHIIYKSCTIKAKIVAQDEKDKGIRGILNFGHTIGHAIEAETSFTEYTHGESVAIGMVAEAELAQLLGLIDKGFVDRLKNLLLKAKLPIKLPNLETDRLIKHMQRDKKNKIGKIVFVLPTKLGRVEMFDNIEYVRLAQILKGS
ncbi:MAG: 3-dehydroquinate synthase [Bacillota bacterium]|jgi:3-dehydroquinate synthase|nr:3-dehydroquinate synthase [Bacillota bacterium]